MEPGLFDFQDYKLFVKAKISSAPKGGWGMRAGLAKALGCQTAYVSQVLGGDAHLSLEQADLTAKFLGLTEEESHFFLLLVQKARAGTRSLSQYFEKQIATVVTGRLVLQNRVGIKARLSAKDQATYYSAWYYAAIHVALSVPSLRTKAALAQRLGLAPSRVAEVLGFLVMVGLAKEKEGRFSIGTSQVHLGSQAPLISKHHTNWRIKAIGSLERGGEEDLHYSSVVTLSESDVIRLKAALVDQITRAKQTIAVSKEESVHCLSLDFFRV